MTRNEIFTSTEYSPFQPLFEKIDDLLSKGDVRLAIDGGSASGKTTLGKLLDELHCCTLFHTDDFFLRSEQRTAERLAEPGGNVDRERFLEEVLIPLSRNDAVNYRRFDCSSFTLSSPTVVIPKQLTVIEGAYSMHPYFERYYNLSVFLDISPELQRERILKRNSPQSAQNFFEKWIPLENRYFESMNIKDRCDLIIPVCI